jgi:hypothetical protein
VQTNTRASHTFIVPHRRDTKSGQVVLTELRDVYENNANNGARRVREAIFAVLPPWYVQEAMDACTETIEKGGGVPLARRIASAIENYAKAGISQEQLEARIGRPVKLWTAQDDAQLLVIFRSLQRGEVTRDEEFPPSQRVTAAEITREPKAAEPAPAAAPAPDAVEPHRFVFDDATGQCKQCGRPEDDFDVHPAQP